MREGRWDAGGRGGMEGEVGCRRESWDVEGEVGCRRERWDVGGRGGM